MQLPDDAWERVGSSLTGQRTQREWVWSRWREVEVHHVDLGLGYAPSEWPVRFVTRGLDDAFTYLPERAARDAMPLDASFRLEATDHDRAWIVRTFDNGDVRVERDPATTTRPSTARSVAGAATCSRGSTGASRTAAASPRPATSPCSVSPSGSRSPEFRR